MMSKFEQVAHRRRHIAALRLGVAAMAIALAAPAQAGAVSARNFNVRDKGSEIVAAGTVCAKRAVRFRWRITFTQGDKVVYLRGRARQRRGCTRHYFITDDDFAPGLWYARAKLDFGTEYVVSPRRAFFVG